MDWNPDREWHPRELMKSTDKNDSDWNTAQTPCTERFHPFSIPTRDCLGKGFAMKSNITRRSNTQTVSQRRRRKRSAREKTIRETKATKKTKSKTKIN